MPEDALMPESRSGEEHGRGVVPDVEKCEMRLEEPELGDCGTPVKRLDRAFSKRDLAIFALGNGLEIGR